MTRTLNPVFANRPQSISPTMSALAHPILYIGAMIFLVGWESAAADTDRTTTIRRLHALPNCSMQGAISDYVCMNTAITNLCEATSTVGKMDVVACRRLSTTGISDDDRLAPLPYHGVVTLPAKLHDSDENSADMELSFYARDTACEKQAAIGYVGLSDGGFPLIETDQGVVEISSPLLKIGYSRARILVDVKSGEIINEFLAPRDFEPAYGFRFESAEKVYFAGDIGCIHAPSLKPGKLRYASRLCGGLLKKDGHGHEAYYHGDEGLEPANASDVAMAVKAVPHVAEYHGEWFKSRVYRVISQDLIVINTVEACT